MHIQNVRACSNIRACSEYVIIGTDIHCIHTYRRKAMKKKTETRAFVLSNILTS